ncbi:ATP-binding cassette domain-containing protein [Bizionia argentinensis JUB59]|uniref:ATP-binding cassette domain-containing protein n=1 Tax=Bizionia argentinensis JUB59 TaxID=1046627 RepID=G2EAN3_9FLAO|nr:AAA family ATPase [Bizionia argentinensis]EGV44498.2 ATP-binding cassette domain-containing protein [Bizionia argentinensis JUB59]
MKISKISFKNIHSLRGEHHIDFLSGPLAESGLFAITGATGSGKSTLLDVITLALYNQVPRIGAISKRIIDGDGGIMTRNAQDCYAEVEYIVNQKTYRSHWSIERNRNNNLNDRKQEIIDVATGDIIVSGKSAVPSKNAELIGLSYDQFVKAMVLSQGEFSKLLKAPRDQRNKLLEDITGAKDYRSIGIAVFKKFKNASDACKEQNIRLGEIELIPEEEKNNLLTEETTLAKTKVAQKKKIDGLKIEIENKKGILKNETILSKNESLQKELSEALENFKKEEETLKKHSKYVGHNTLISNFEQKDKAHKENSEELTRQKTNETQVLKEKDNLQELASELLGEKIKPEQYAEQLEQLRKTVTDLKQEETLATAQAKLHEDHIHKILLNVNKGAERIRFNENPAVFIDSINPVEEKVEVFLHKKKIDNEEALAEKDASLSLKSGFINKLKVALTDYNALVKNKTSKETELTESDDLFKKYKASLELLEFELKALQKEVEKLNIEEEKRKKHQSLETHRNLLENGEACPLCGSLEHPFATDKPIFELKEDALKTKTDFLATKRELKTSTQTNLENEEKKGKALRKSIAEISETIKPKFKEVENLCKSLKIGIVENVEAVEVLEKELTTDVQTVERLKKAFELRNLLATLKETSNLWLTSSEVKLKKQTRRKQLYAADDIDAKVQDLNSKWAANTQDVVNTNKLISSLKARITEIVKERDVFQKQLDDILKNENIESLLHLKSLILPEAKADSIRQRDKDLQLKQERLKTEKENALKEIEAFIKLITIQEPIATLEMAFHKNEEEYNILNERIITIKNKLTADKQTKEKQEKLLTKLKAYKKEEALWKTMNGLIGDANGKRFSNFVQDLTLEQLIGYANLRLKDLSDRYILDIPTADEADKNDSLKVFDSHQGDARRSINTLSGGETFMVSLAMAFALSDLAAKNVKIESIFIDEGFGTLDPETLNQAITILEKMQNEGDKSIGVISHVEALKERISTQIRLEKMGSGYSTIQII